MLHPFWIFDEMVHYVLEAHCESDDDWEDVITFMSDQEVDENIASSSYLVLSALVTAAGIFI